MSQAETTPSAQAGKLEKALDQAAEAVAVGTRKLEELAQAGAGGEELSLQQLSDVPIPVTVQLGRVRLTLGDLCRLKSGSLLELDRESHEPADILVNGKIVAHGEIVTIENHYGVRITSVEP
ncbi:MAG: flagellar motor switch protein FliN [Planctomycetes bacterium]|nr:flagellar motor switch protein FliN [Planctomycetota bacterium]